MRVPVGPLGSRVPQVSLPVAYLGLLTIVVLPLARWNVS